MCVCVFFFQNTHKSMNLTSFDLTSFRHLLHDRAVAIYLELVRNVQEYIQPLIGQYTWCVFVWTEFTN